MVAGKEVQNQSSLLPRTDPTGWCFCTDVTRIVLKITRVGLLCHPTRVLPLGTMFVFFFSVFVITPGLHAQLSSTIPLSVGPFSPQPYTSISTSSHSSETLPGHLDLESEPPYSLLSNQITQPTPAAHISISSQASLLPVETRSVVGQWAIETMPDGLEMPFAVPSNVNNSDKPTCMAYYADWTSQAVPPKDIPYSLLDWIDFAFAIPDPQGNLTIDAPALLGEVVERGHKNGTKVKLSIGGWTGSRCVLYTFIIYNKVVHTSIKGTFPAWSLTQACGKL